MYLALFNIELPIKWTEENTIFEWAMIDILVLLGNGDSYALGFAGLCVDLAVVGACVIEDGDVR